MIWTNEDKLIMYVGRIITPEALPYLFPITTILPPLLDVVGLTCGTTDSSRLYLIQGKDMKVRELTKAKYHKNSKHITIKTLVEVYTTDKKTFFDYYKKQFHAAIHYIETCINKQKQITNTPINETNTIRDVQYAFKSIETYKLQKINVMNTYRQTIETIKKLGN